MIPPKRLDIFPPDWGMLRSSRCDQIFLQNLSFVPDEKNNLGFAVEKKNDGLGFAVGKLNFVIFYFPYQDLQLEKLDFVIFIFLTSLAFTFSCVWV